jgi:hypothetical protein
VLNGNEVDNPHYYPLLTKISASPIERAGNLFPVRFICPLPGKWPQNKI